MKRSLSQRSRSLKEVLPLLHLDRSNVPPRHAPFRWQFGVRSRSPPMEIMMETYRSMGVLGMEWRECVVTEYAQPDHASLPRTHNPLFVQSYAKLHDVTVSAHVRIVSRLSVLSLQVRIDVQLYRASVEHHLIDLRLMDYLDGSAKPYSGHKDLKLLSDNEPTKFPPITNPFLFLEASSRIVNDLADRSY